MSALAFVWNGIIGLMNCHGAGSGMSALHDLVSLAAALNNADADGRMVVDKSEGSIKFVLLNAAAHFVKARPSSLFPDANQLLLLFLH